MFRKLVSYALGRDVTIIKAVQMMFIPKLHQFPNVTTIVLNFDSPHLLPEMRCTFHAERRYASNEKPPKVGERRCDEDGRNYKEKEFPASDVEIEALGINHMPVAWAKYWNSKRGKHALWTKIEECIKYCLTTIQGGRRGVQYILDCIDGTRWFYPALGRDRITMPPVQYGEGDMKSIMWALHLRDAISKDAPVLVMTIDWDVVLALTQYHSDIHVWIGYVYVHADNYVGVMPYGADLVNLTRRKAIEQWKDDARETLEIINMNRVCRDLSRTERQHYLMLCICIGGVDYCYGLGKYGFGEKDMLHLTLELRITSFQPHWISSMYSHLHKPYQRMLVFNLGVFMKTIVPVWNQRKCRYLLVEELNKEIHNIMYCLMYFMGFDSQRTPGGPCPPNYDIDLFPGFDDIPTLMHTVERCRDPEDLFPLVVYTEAYPYDASSLPHDPDVIYSGKQLESVQIHLMSD